MNAIRRGGWASLPDMAKSGTGTRNVVGAGMEGRGIQGTQGDLVGSGRDRTTRTELPLASDLETGSQGRGADEESERFIVATPQGKSSVGGASLWEEMPSETREE